MFKGITGLSLRDAMTEISSMQGHKSWNIYYWKMMEAFGYIFNEESVQGFLLGSLGILPYSLIR